MDNKTLSIQIGQVTTKLATRMSQYGKITAYRAEEESISAYLERVELYFQANDIEEAKQVPILLSSIGAKTYELLRSLTAPKAPKEKSLKDLKTILKSHFEPAPIVIAERYRFHRRQQAEGESIAEYVAELRRLTTHCKFENTVDYLEESLRDRFVCGLRTESTRKRLLTEKNLTFTTALEIAQSLETASKDAQQLKGEASGAVHSVTSPKPMKEACYRCGQTNHKASECRFKEATCHNCGKKGHIKVVCRSKKQPQRGKRQFQRRQETTKWVDTHDSGEDTGDTDVEVYSVGNHSSHPILVEVQVDGQELTMEIDTGAAVSIISEQELKKVLPDAEIKETNVKLRTYTSERIPLLGVTQVTVKYGEQSRKLTLYVTKGDGPCLLGREWLRSIQLDWKTIGLTILDTASTQVELLLKEYNEIFRDELGTMNSIQASLKLKEDVAPRFHRPRSLPFALKEPVEQELHRLEEAGILEKVSHSEWAAPIVPVPKKDGIVRLCGDYKVTVNQCLDVDQYPIPKPDELFATLPSGKFFSKLDLSQAYQQMQMEEESAKYLTINTHLGLYQYKRLPFGVASAPAIFQRAMDQILQGIPGVICYIDDILVISSNVEEHLQRLEEVLKRLKSHGLRVKRNKCVFCQSSVEYLGHLIDAEGLHALPSKVAAILQAPEPQNIQQLRSFLGLINYYSKFVPNLSTVLHPLNNLLKHDVKWNWTAKYDEAFQLAKEGLASSQVLARYDPSLPLKMAADASAYGIGAVISHTYPDGSERPIAFASRTLSSSEKNYAQIEKEALALVYGVRHFHQYLYGRRFTLVTDHRPLTTILSPKRGIPSLAAARLQRWAIILSAYWYDIEFRRTQDHGNADGLSRLPLPSVRKSHTPSEAEIFNVAQIDSLPVTSSQLERATRRDSLLNKVRQYTKTGWPQSVQECLKPFWNRRDELSLEGDCLLWGIRVIVPKKLQEQVVSELHRGHQGVARMKAVARSYVWWPNIDKSLEEVARNCKACQSVKSSPAVAPLHPWVWPERPWQRVHIDFAGPLKGKMYFVLVDAHSKWPEVVEMQTTTAEKTIQVLRRMFAAYGLPEQVVSDNGSQFTSQEFAEFMKRNGIKHIKSTPYHPSTNGLAERFVQTFKRAMLKDFGSRPTHHQLANFLLVYRSSPHTTTNRTPSELFLKQQLRTRMDLLRPDSRVQTRVSEKQGSQKLDHDRRSVQREYRVGETIMARNYRDGPKWMEGVVVERKGPLSYVVQVNHGMLWRRHTDQLRNGPSTVQQTDSDVEVPTGPETEEREEESTPETENGGVYSESPDNGALHAENNAETADEPETVDTTVRRYPSRVRQPPQRYQ